MYRNHFLPNKMYINLKVLTATMNNQIGDHIDCTEIITKNSGVVESFTCKNLSRWTTQINSMLRLDKAPYSAFELDLEIVGCFWEHLEIRFCPS